MKLLLIILILRLTTCVTTYGKAAAYKRLLYYYAYKLDCAINQIPKKFAPGCGPDCTFNEFINFIDGLEDVDIIQEEFPQLGTTATALENLGHNRGYKPDLILPGGKPNARGSPISHILEAVAKFVKNHINETSDKKYKARI